MAEQNCPDSANPGISKPDKDKVKNENGHSASSKTALRVELAAPQMSEGTSSSHQKGVLHTCISGPSSANAKGESDGLGSEVEMKTLGDSIKEDGSAVKTFGSPGGGNSEDSVNCTTGQSAEEKMHEETELPSPSFSCEENDGRDIIIVDENPPKATTDATKSQHDDDESAASEDFPGRLVQGVILGARREDETDQQSSRSLTLAATIRDLEATPGQCPEAAMTTAPPRVTLSQLRAALCFVSDGTSQKNHPAELFLTSANDDTANQRQSEASALNPRSEAEVRSGELPGRLINISLPMGETTKISRSVAADFGRDGFSSVPSVSRLDKSTTMSLSAPTSSRMEAVDPERSVLEQSQSAARQETSTGLAPGERPPRGKSCPAMARRGSSHVSSQGLGEPGLGHVLEAGGCKYDKSTETQLWPQQLAGVGSCRTDSTGPLVPPHLPLEPQVRVGFHPEAATRAVAGVSLVTAAGCSPKHGATGIAGRQLHANFNSDSSGSSSTLKSEVRTTAARQACKVKVTEVPVLRAEFEVTSRSQGQGLGAEWRSKRIPEMASQPNFTLDPQCTRTSSPFISSTSESFVTSGKLREGKHGCDSISGSHGVAAIHLHVHDHLCAISTSSTSKTRLTSQRPMDGRQEETNKSDSSLLCRICQMGETESGEPVKRAECLCKGDLELIHRSCLVEWVRYKGNNMCELCRAQFSDVDPPVRTASDLNRQQIMRNLLRHYSRMRPLSSKKRVLTGLFLTFLVTMMTVMGILTKDADENFREKTSKYTLATDTEQHRAYVRFAVCWSLLLFCVTLASATLSFWLCVEVAYFYHRRQVWRLALQLTEQGPSTAGYRGTAPPFV